MFVTCVPVVDCSLTEPSGAAVDWSSQKSNEDSSDMGREWRDMWPVGRTAGAKVLMLETFPAFIYRVGQKSLS